MKTYVIHYGWKDQLHQQGEGFTSLSRENVIVAVQYIIDDNPDKSIVIRSVYCEEYIETSKEETSENPS